MDSSNLGPSVLAVSWVFGALAIIVVGTRYYVRLRIVERFTIDDWLIALVLILALFNGIFYTLSVHHGLGQALQTLTKTQISNTKKWVYLLDAKCGIRTHRIRVLAAGAATSDVVEAEGIALDDYYVEVYRGCCGCCGELFAVNGYWDKDVNATCMPVVVVRVTYFQGAFCALVDFILAVFPTTLLWNLQMKLKMKVSLSIVMGLGVL
ncbi:integral membrane protein [Rutstroemia sp. NJR-2017a BBW]|nr:integral membrane protein [Rutstroemia sp. NJR-2017a BBW]